LLKLQEKLGALQEEKHQLFLQLKKVLHEEEKRRRKEQSDLTTLTAAAYPQSLGVPGAHLLGMAGSPGGPRSGLIGADRAKQMFGPPVISPRHFGAQPPFGAGGDPAAFGGAQGGPPPAPFAVGQSPAPPPPFPPAQPPPAYGGAQQLRPPAAFPALPFLPQQPPGGAFGLHGHFPPAQPGFLPPSSSLPLQKLEHANSQSGFSEPALHPGPALLPSPQLPVPIQGNPKPALPFPAPPRAASPGSFPPHGAAPQPPPPHARHGPFLPHGQGQRFYHK
ncbi:LOW QUALITY PROTEIN: G protein pathway suppressor 2, partial [Aphelocoma coerulescens]|uniref:LOW QUALITY PROTEIN: G protein pathway suppressor 2 n=1 Tax=Aphelocoma coerulescens TaxID=39617 RepID=UPI003604F28D